jgi:hypothetical protein
VRSKFLASLALLVALALAPQGGAQSPNAYFSLSTTKAYLPGEKVGVQVYSTNVEALEFRVYKVKDPVAFFERLDLCVGLFDAFAPSAVPQTRRTGWAADHNL